MKNTIFATLIVFLLTSCSRNENDPNNNATTGINAISGLYKGGTLTWGTANLTDGTTKSGTDPHATFDVKYLGNDNISITIITTAPIPIKSINAKLKTKEERNLTSTSYLGTFTFELGDEQIFATEQNGTYSGSVFSIQKFSNEITHAGSVQLYNKTNSSLILYDVSGTRN